MARPHKGLGIPARRSGSLGESRPGRHLIVQVVLGHECQNPVRRRQRQQASAVNLAHQIRVAQRFKRKVVGLRPVRRRNALAWLSFNEAEANPPRKCGARICAVCGKERLQ